VGVSRGYEPFFELGDGRLVSRCGLTLHVSATDHSARSGVPGYVPDTYLNEACAETTTAAVELCLTGLWERVDDGYRVLDQEYLEQVIVIQRNCDRREARHRRWRSA
jgi:hypothetical protein